MARYMRTDLGVGHTRLRPPTVVTAAPLAPPLNINTVATRARASVQRNRREPYYRLRPPVVVTPAATQIFFGPKIYLNVMLPERLRATVTRRRPDYNLGPPLIIGAGIAWHGPGVYLTRSYTRRGLADLKPPTVVTPFSVQIFFGPKIYLNVMTPERLRQTVTRRRPTYQLSPPIIPDLAEPTRVTLAPSRRQLGRAFLIPPAVIAPVVSYGPEVHLAYSRRGASKSHLQPPTDTIGLEDQGQVFEWLTYSRRGTAKSHLSPPVVVVSAAQVYYGPAVHLTRIKPSRVQYVLRPAVIPPLARPLDTTLAPQRRGQAKSVLRAPQVVFTAVELSGPEITLARIRPVRTQARLLPPAVVVQPQVLYALSIWLAYSRRGRPLSRLQAPTVVFPFFARKLPVALAPQRRGTPKSRLFPPIVVFLAVEIYGPVVSLTRIKPPPTVSVLRQPTDVTEAEEFPVLRVHLAYSRRGRPLSFLRPFSARAFEVSYGPQITLAPSRRPITKSHLGPPAVVGLEPFRGLLLHLTYSRRPVTKSRLRPPTVVAPVVSYGPFLWLTYGRRGTPKPRLRPAVVVSAPPAYQQVLPPALTYSRRGRPIYKLRPPTRVFPVLFFGPQVTLRPQVRGIPKPFLRPPQVVRQAVEIYGPQVELTYSRRPKTRSELLPPTVVEKFIARPRVTVLARITHPPVQHVLREPVVVRLAVEIYGPRTWLTYSRRPKVASQLFPGLVGKAPFRGILVSLAPSRFPRPVYEIKPPTVVERPIFFTNVHLTYSRRGRPLHLLKPPTVVRAAFFARPVQVHLTRITPPPVLSLLKPPSVVGAGIAFYGPLTALVRIRPPRVIHVLRVTLVAFRRPHGDVCGFDIAGTFVCGLEVPGSQVSGTVAVRFQISGTSRAGSTVSGSESAGGSVSGSDRKAT